MTAIYVPPKNGGRRRAEMAPAPTYRLKLERETDGAVVHMWGGIPHNKIEPVLKAIGDYLPWVAKAAAARAAFDRVLDLFR